MENLIELEDAWYSNKEKKICFVKKKLQFFFFCEITRMMEKNKDLQVLDHQSVISAKLFPIYPLIGQMTVVISDLCLKKHLYVIVSHF